MTKKLPMSDSPRVLTREEVRKLLREGEDARRYVEARIQRMEPRDEVDRLRDEVGRLRDEVGQLHERNRAMREGLNSRLKTWRVYVVTEAENGHYNSAAECATKAEELQFVIDAWSDALAGSSAWADERESMQRERDEARAEVERLTRERDELKARLAHAEADAEQAIHNEAYMERQRIVAYIHARIAHTTLDDRVSMRERGVMIDLGNAIERREHEQ